MLCIFFKSLFCSDIGCDLYIYHIPAHHKVATTLPHFLSSYSNLQSFTLYTILYPISGMSFILSNSF